MADNETFEEGRKRLIAEHEPEKFRRILINSARRAMLAYMAVTLARIADDEHPVMAIGGSVLIAGAELGDLRAIHSFSGNAGIHTMLGASVEYQDYLMSVSRARMRKDATYAEKGLGDAAVIKTDGTVAIECPCDHEGEADRELRENAMRFLLGSILAFGTIYSNTVPAHISAALDQIYAFALAELPKHQKQGA